ncbi:MAG: nicotinamide phosphoribosyltransferase domain-containing protein [Vibrio splendidus]
MSFLYEIGNAKVTIADQLNPDIEWVQSYSEARAWGKDGESFPFLGLPVAINKFLATPITHAEIEEVHALMGYSDQFPRAMFEHIVDNHNGFLPVTIIGKKEGDILEPGEVAYTIENTDPLCAVLPIYLDRVMLRYSWFGTTYARKLCRFVREIDRFASATSDASASYHGRVCGQYVASELNEMAQGYAYMLLGLDPDISGAMFLNRHYQTNLISSPSMVSEHNAILSWGGAENEFTYLERMLTRNPDDFVGLFVDTYDADRVMREYIPKLLPLIQKRTIPVLLSVDGTNVYRDIIHYRDVLEELVGVRLNEHGFKVLNAPIRLSQGDDIDHDTLVKIIDRLIADGWSVENFFFLLTDDNLHNEFGRGVLGFIQKICATKDNLGKLVSVNKSPVTELRKTTKKGVQCVRDGMLYYHNGKVIAETFEAVQLRLLQHQRNNQ